jgi:DNA-binding IclR family transcriptional regulator
MQTLERGFKILWTLRLRGSAKLREIAAALPAESNTAWNLLNALTKLGYVKKTGRNCYSTGPECARLFGGGSATLKDLMRPFLEELCKDIKETAVAVNLAGTELNVIQKAVYSGAVRLGIERPVKNALYYWASGRVVMAWQPDCVIKRTLERRGFPSGEEWRGVKTEAALMERLREIRSACFAERRSSNALSLAVPVFDAQGNFHFGLGVTYSVPHDSKIQRQTVLSHLLLTAEKLSRLF